MAKKKLLRLTESDLKNMIKESVQKVLNEGHWNGQSYDHWEKLRELLGDDGFIDSLWNYLNGDQIDDFIEYTSRMNDCKEEIYGSEDEEYEDEEEDEEEEIPLF